MADNYSAEVNRLDTPPRRAREITPSDVADLEFTTRCITVGASGTVRMRYAQDQTPVTEFVAAGGNFACRVTRIYDTGTTATDIVIKD